MSSWMVGIDTGGTFTDLIAFEVDSGELRVAKVSSEPSDPSGAVMAALEELFAADKSIRFIRGVANTNATEPRAPEILDVTLVGQPEEIEASLAKHGTANGVEIVAATDVISMHDEATDVRRKPQASITS